MTKPLEDYSYILFGTRKRDGSFVDTPVWFAKLGEDYIVFSAADAGKVKRLRNFSTARVAPCTVSGKSLGDSIAAEAILLNSPELIDKAHRALVKKYGWQMRGLDLASKASGKYNKRQFIKITLT